MYCFTALQDTEETKHLRILFASEKGNLSLYASSLSFSNPVAVIEAREHGWTFSRMPHSYDEIDKQQKSELHMRVGSANANHLDHFSKTLTPEAIKHHVLKLLEHLHSPVNLTELNCNQSTIWNKEIWARFVRSWQQSARSNGHVAWDKVDCHLAGEISTLVRQIFIFHTRKDPLGKLVGTVTRLRLAFIVDVCLSVSLESRIYKWVNINPFPTDSSAAKNSLGVPAPLRKWMLYHVIPPVG